MAVQSARPKRRRTEPSRLGRRGSKMRLRKQSPACSPISEAGPTRLRRHQQQRFRRHPPMATGREPFLLQARFKQSLCRPMMLHRHRCQLNRQIPAQVMAPDWDVSVSWCPEVVQCDFCDEREGIPTSVDCITAGVLNRCCREPAKKSSGPPRRLHHSFCEKHELQGH